MNNRQVDEINFWFYRFHDYPQKYYKIFIKWVSLRYVQHVILNGMQLMEKPAPYAINKTMWKNIVEYLELRKTKQE